MCSCSSRSLCRSEAAQWCFLLTELRSSSRSSHFLPHACANCWCTGSGATTVTSFVSKTCGLVIVSASRIPVQPSVARSVRCFATVKFMTNLIYKFDTDMRETTFRVVWRAHRTRAAGWAGSYRAVRLVVVPASSAMVMFDYFYLSLSILL